MLDIIKKDIKTLRTLLDKKEISALELAEAFIQNADKNNFITLLEEDFKKQAKIAQDKIDSTESSILTGIPYVVKDNICTKDLLTTSGSKMLYNFIPPFDAYAVSKLKEQGAVLIGKTNLSDFSVYSGEKDTTGKACCAFALSTDCYGEARFEAKNSGLYAVRPTYGAVSRSGIIGVCSSMEQITPIARTASDCEIVLSVISGKDPSDVFSINAPDYLLDSKIGDKISNIKCKTIKTEELPITEFTDAAFDIIYAAEGSSNLARFDGVKYGFSPDADSYENRVIASRSGGFSDTVKQNIMLGNFFLSGDNINNYFKKALAVRQEVVRTFDSLFKDNDIIITFVKDREVLSPLAKIPSIIIKDKCFYAKKLNENILLYTADVFEKESKI